MKSKSAHRTLKSGTLYPGWQQVVSFCAVFSIFFWFIYRVIRHISGFVGNAPQDRYRDFFEFYSGAEALFKGSDVYAAGHLGYIYPPLLAFLMVPLSWLSLAQAAYVWLAIKTGLLAACGWLGAEEVQMRLSQPTDRGSISVVFLFGLLFDLDKLRTEMTMQQSNLLVLLCFVLALRWLDRRPLFSGLALGFGANIKYVTLIALPYLLIRKRFKAALATVVSTILWGLLPALFIGWERNMDLLGKAIGGLANLSSAHSAGAGNARIFGPEFGLSIPAFAARYFGSGGHTFLSLSVAGAVALLFLVAALGIYRSLGIHMLRGRGGQVETQGFMPGVVALEWAGLIIIILAFSPQTNSPHLSMLLLPCLMAAGVLLMPQGRISGHLLILGLLIMFAGLVLPIRGVGIQDVFPLWHRLSGVSWCIMVMYLTLLWTGLGRLKAQTDNGGQA